MKIRTAVQLNYKTGKTGPVWHETILLDAFIGMVILKNDLERIMDGTKVCCAGSGQSGQSKVRVTRNTVIGMDTYNRLSQKFGQSAVEGMLAEQVYSEQREHNRITSACGNFFRCRYTLAKTLAMNVSIADLLEWGRKYGLLAPMQERIESETIPEYDNVEDLDTTEPTDDQIENDQDDNLVGE